MSFFKKFKEEEYLKANPDVAVAIERGILKSGKEHYFLYGKSEGRRLKGSPILSRKDKVFYGLNKNGLGLEIGPSHNPIAPKKEGFNVHILDHLSADDLRKKYFDQGDYGVNIENIEDVDFIWTGQPYSELIGSSNCYDWIIASHVVEHIPDLLSYLRQCTELLKEGGLISLVVPDKRYCFDYFSKQSTTGNILDAYYERRTKPTPGQIFDHFANSIKCGGRVAWSDDLNGGEKEFMYTFLQAQEKLQDAIAEEYYIDAHCWKFTPSSFIFLISDLNKLGLIDLSIKHHFDTEGCEFYITLEKSASSIDFNRMEAISRIEQDA